MARVLVLDVIGGKGLYESECEALADFYKELRCDTFDIACRKVGDKYFDFFVDDIGLFQDNPRPSVLDENMQPMLVGNLVIANHDSEGATTSLTDDDVALIKNHITTVVNFDGDLEQWQVVFPATY